MKPVRSPKPMVFDRRPANVYHSADQSGPARKRRGALNRHRARRPGGPYMTARAPGDKMWSDRDAQRFVRFFEQATGFRPYPYQIRMALMPGLPLFVRVHTGAGKTAAAVFYGLPCCLAAFRRLPATRPPQNVSTLSCFRTHSESTCMPPGLTPSRSSSSLMPRASWQVMQRLIGTPLLARRVSILPML